MHPRNPYSKSKPDFAKLSKKHPFLAPFVTITNGKGHVDFKNKDALRALTRALLLDDFNVDLIIPMNSLVPVIPQRLNYILWIEDLFNQTTDQLCGLDIGTGGTAIYALLCARKNNWKMVGTDIVEESIDFAKKNIQKNNLNNLIQVQLVHESNEGKFFNELEGEFHFSMCNPPFFSSEEETDSLAKARKLSRPLPSGAKTGTSSELVASGGELEFLISMISESRVFATKVGIFTTMVGIKSDLKFLTSALKANKALGYTTTKFIQGKTMRWGLAWTFSPKYAHILTAQQPSSTPIRLQLPCKCSHEAFVSNIKKIFLELEFQFLNISDNGIEAIAESNTWTNQRRKRRAALRNQEKGTPPEETETKRTKLSDTSSPDEFHLVDPGKFEEKSYGLHLEIIFSKDHAVEGGKEIFLRHLGGSFSSDAVHQIIQYLKNNYFQRNCGDI